jgi:HSP20 family molecular chaperone IbpA
VAFSAPKFRFCFAFTAAEEHKIPAKARNGVSALPVTIPRAKEAKRKEERKAP